MALRCLIQVRALCRVGRLAGVSSPKAGLSSLAEDHTEKEKWHQWYVEADGKEPWTEVKLHQ